MPVLRDENEDKDLLKMPSDYLRRNMPESEQESNDDSNLSGARNEKYLKFQTNNPFVIAVILLFGCLGCLGLVLLISMYL